jgi:leucyl/phenylalanyl-tRNA--protein transferase
MAIRWLSPSLRFPSPHSADADGIVAVGGDCSPARLLLAYRSGIFPWPLSDTLPLFWFSPDPRWVVLPSEAHLPKSLRKQMRRGVYEVRCDTAFEAVIDACSAVPRPGQQGTWIIPELREGFVELHRMGYAHSIEAWQDGTLVGGLYGLALGRAFFGESMFALAPDASKVAFATLLANLHAMGLRLRRLPDAHRPSRALRGHLVEPAAVPRRPRPRPGGRRKPPGQVAVRPGPSGCCASHARVIREEGFRPRCGSERAWHHIR